MAISKRVGHSSVATTMNIYSHLLDGEEDKLIDKIEELEYY